MKTKTLAKSRRSKGKPERKIVKGDHVPATPKQIMAPVDFSPFSDRALQYAVSFAQRFNAKLLLLHVVEAFPIDYMMGIKAAETANDWQRKQAASRLQDLARRLTSEASIAADSAVKFGKPFQMIVDVAKERSVDLIIIATHGYTGLKHIQLGSTAEMVVRYAPCPVLVLPNPARAESAKKER